MTWESNNISAQRPNSSFPFFTWAWTLGLGLRLVNTTNLEFWYLSPNNDRTVPWLLQLSKVKQILNCEGQLCSDSASAAQCSGVRRPEEIRDIEDIGDILLHLGSRQCSDGGMGHAQTEKISGVNKEIKPFFKEENAAFRLQNTAVIFKAIQF